MNGGSEVLPLVASAVEQLRDDDLTCALIPSRALVFDITALCAR